MIYFRFVAARMLKILIWVAIVSLAWMTFSCEEFCEEPNRTAVVVYFFNDEDVLIKVKNIEIKGVGNDSILYPNDKIFGGKDFSQIMLPVNPTADSISFSIKNDLLPADIITIRYSRHNGFISPQCGCVTFAEIQGVPETTFHSIRRIEVVQPSVTTVSYRQGVINAENIRIYY